MPIKRQILSEQISRERILKGFPCGADGKESAYNTGDLSSIPVLPTSPGEGNGSPVFMLGELHGQRNLADYS